MILADPFPPSLPAPLDAVLTTRTPMDEDVAPMVELIQEDRRRFDPEARVEAEGVRSRLVGLRSWSRRQLVVVPREPVSATPDVVPVGWICVEDRAAGRSNVQWTVAEHVPHRTELIAALLAWAAEVGGSFARHRGIETTQLNVSVDSRDKESRTQLAAAGYGRSRSWLHMERPVSPGEASSTPAPRDGVRVRTVHRHASGLPVAQDVRTVHRILEESFADHFNSYRESFPEFVQRLTEVPGSRWDHWWIAEIQQADGIWWPGGGLVADVMPATARAGEGTYLEYLGVHRSARGRGIAKALLHAAIRDAAQRGRVRVGLEVDADSPTGADGLYRTMGWETTEVTESWHARAESRPSYLLRDEE